MVYGGDVVLYLIVFLHLLCFGFLWVKFNIIIRYVAMKSYLDARSFRVKVDNDLGGTGIYHEESICTCKEKRRFYGWGTVMRICVGE